MERYKEVLKESQLKLEKRIARSRMISGITFLIILTVALKKIGLF